MICYFCKQYIGLFSMDYFCSYCSQLRRAILLYKKERINEIFKNELGFSMFDDELKEEPKQQEQEPVSENPEVTITPEKVEEKKEEESQKQRQLKRNYAQSCLALSHKNTE